jgi:hypothetical protein
MSYGTNARYPCDLHNSLDCVYFVFPGVPACTDSRENAALHHERAAEPAGRDTQSRLCVNQALVDHRLTFSSDLSTASSRVGLRSGLSHCTSYPPLTETSSGICSLYAMDLLEGGADDLPKIGSADAPSAGAERLANVQGVVTRR